MMSGFLLIRRKMDKENETGVGKVLLLFLCVVRENREGDGTEFVQFIECVPPLDAVDDALECICLQ